MTELIVNIAVTILLLGGIVSFIVGISKTLEKALTKIIRLWVE